MTAAPSGRAALERHVRQHLRRLPEGARGLLVAVSGGRDSMALLHLLRRVRSLNVEAAHVDYGLRGAASRADRRLVERICEELETPLHLRVASAREREAIRSGGLQAAARELRYGWFGELLRSRGLAWIATGHHAADQVETFFLHLFRGAGLAGLRGMQVLEPGRRVFRPLLEVWPHAIAAYVAAAGVAYRDDASNARRDYERNRVRLDLLPWLEERFGPGVCEAVHRSMSILGPEDDVIDEATMREAAHVLRQQAAGVEIESAALAELPLALARRVVRLALEEVAAGSAGTIELAHVDAVLRLAAASTPGKELRLPSARVQRRREGLVLTAPVPELVESRVVRRRWKLPVPGERVVPELAVRLAVTCHPAPPSRPSDPSRLIADRSCLATPLWVRVPRRGDRIDPLGMGGHTRSLARLLMDRGLGRDERARVVVVEDSKGPLWVPGHVTAERVRITDATREVLEVTVGPIEID